MNEGDHFSESVTFNAVGLDKVVEQTRQARLETDQLAASQKKFADQIAKRLGYENYAQAVNRNRGGLPPTGSFGSQRAGYAGQSQGLGQGIGQGGTMRVNQPIRIQAQSVILQVQSMMQQEQAARRQRLEDQQRYHGGSQAGGLGGNVLAAGVLAKGVGGNKALQTAIEKSQTAIEKSMDKVAERIKELRGDQRPKNALRFIPDEGKSTEEPPAKMTVAQRKKQEAQARREQTEAARNSVTDDYKVLMTQPSTEEAQLKQQAALNRANEMGTMDFISDIHMRLKELTVKQLQALEKELNLQAPPMSKKKKAEESGEKDPTEIGDGRLKADRTNFLANSLQERLINQGQGNPEDQSWRRQYAAEMKQLTSLSANLRRSYEQARIHLDKFGQSAKAWATSPEMQTRLNQVRDRLKKDIDREDVRNKAGYAALGMVGLGAGMTWQGLQKTVAGQQFNNEIARLQHELANAFGPALRKATEYLGQFTNGLAGMSPRQQRNLMYAGVGVAGYGALKAAGMGGLVEKPLSWAAGLGLMGAARAAPLVGAGASMLGGGASWLGGMAAAGAGKAAAAGAGGVAGAVLATGAAGYFAGRAISPYLFSGTQRRLDAFDRRSRGEFTDREIDPNAEMLNKLDNYHDPKKRQLAHRNKEQELIREQQQIEGEYSTFGKLAGSLPTVGGYHLFGSYGRRSDEVQAQLQLVEKQRIAGKSIVPKRNEEPLAGGGFEGFLDTYRRTEEAVGRIDPGLAGAPVQRAEGEDKLVNAADKLAAAADKLADALGEGDKPKADGKLQKNW